MTVFLFKVQGGGFGGEIWNVGYHFQTPDFPALKASDAVVACGAFLDSWWTGAAGGSPGLAPNLSNVTTLAGATIYVLDPTSGHAIDKALVAKPLVGLVVGSPLPNQISLCVTHRTNTPGRIGRGRSFCPGPAANTLAANGTLSAACRDNYANTVGKSLLLMQTSGYTPVLFTPGKPNRAITSVDCGSILDTQRRRRNKNIENRSTSIPARASLDDTISVLL